ncbi:hypothetical protein SB759_34310, partial [Pseudomonas sp. SIMBA_059]
RQHEKRQAAKKPGGKQPPGTQPGSQPANSSGSPGSQPASTAEDPATEPAPSCGEVRQYAGPDKAAKEAEWKVAVLQAAKAAQACGKLGG